MSALYTIFTATGPQIKDVPSAVLASMPLPAGSRAVPQNELDPWNKGGLRLVKGSKT